MSAVTVCEQSFSSPTRVEASTPIDEINSILEILKIGTTDPKAVAPEVQNSLRNRLQELRDAPIPKPNSGEPLFELLSEPQMQTTTTKPESNNIAEHCIRVAVLVAGVFISAGIGYLVNTKTL